MVAERIPLDEAAPVDVAVLDSPLKFPCGRIARNRLMKAAMTEKLATFCADPAERGLPTQQLINLYEKWGHGGAGMVVTGNIITHPTNLEAAGNVVVCHETYTPKMVGALKRLATAGRCDGALMIGQISNAGRQTPYAVDPTPFSASDIQLVFPHGIGLRFGTPVPLTKAQIKREVVDRFVFTALALQEAGFDGVQLHAAHGYLLSQFLAPNTNKRDDEYGGSIENRFRIVKEVYKAIRDAIPKTTGFVVGIKINSVEFQKDGLSIDDAKFVCSQIEELGFDFVEMSGGNYEDIRFHHVRESTRKREAFFLEFTDQLRPHFKRTRMYVTGGFRTVVGMVHAVESGAADAIGLARPAAAEPDLPRNLLAGHVRSAAATKVDPNNFLLGMIAANTQMAQAGRRSLCKCNGDIMADIVDLSCQATFEKYMSAVSVYIAQSIEATDNGKVMSKVFEFCDGECAASDC